MENVSQTKVFEFAKEIGMETLALMDKIREWKLPVRSHMAELDTEMQDTIRTRLKDEKSGAGEKTTKKKVAKKAAAGDAAEKPAKAAKAKAEPKAPAAKKAATKKAPPAAAAAAAAAEAAAAKKGAVVVKKAAAKVVIRRKTDEEEAAETAAAEAAAAAAVVQEETPAVEARSAEVASAPEEEAPAMVAAPEVEAAPQAAEIAPAAVEAEAPVQAAATLPGEGPSSSGPVPSRKREVVMTSSGPTSGIRSEAPRRNIVGRMDLSRVQAPPSAGGSRPGGPSIGGPGGGPGGPGPRGMGPRPLRTGFVAQASPGGEVPAVGGDDRRRFEDRRVTRSPGQGPGGPGAPGGATKEKEEEVKHFSATEFRKREMVFQPKKKKGTLGRVAMKTELTKAKASKRVVKVNQSMKLSELANEMGVKAGQLTKALMQQGVMATMNTELDFDTIALIAPEFQFEAQNVHQTVDDMIGATAFGELSADVIERPPVVTIMGHVDHGKTSLLDAIRKARVAAGEAGGITQHIGAYQVTTENGHLITFIDTPGHEAFTAMRARGANATDIAVIVVAADDGVMPQTIEAVSHAKAAGVPIIVALNKMDKAGANPDRVKQQLTEQQLVPEEWGGDTIYVPVSAHTKEGLPALLEQIYAVAEVEELRANPKRSATGIVIESRMDKGRGAVATLLIQDGTLKVGQSIIVGTVPGRVRSLMDYKGMRVNEAGPATPVEILGLPEVPLAGDRFDVTTDDQAAEEISKTRKQRALTIAVEGKGKVTLEDIFSKLKQGDVKELGIVLKSDVAGSSEAIKGMLDKVGTAEVKVKLVHAAVGGINESDILLASAAKSIVVGFNVRPDNGALAAAKRLAVEIKTYTIVYEMMDDLKKALGGLLQPDIVEKQLGRAEVRNTFNVPKLGTIAGCFVVDGKIARNAEVRLLRDNKIVYTGKLASLKRFKDDAKEVAQGYECGMGIEGYNDVKVGDVIEAFAKESVVRGL